MSVAEKLRGFEAEWDGEDIKIWDVILRLRKGIYPRTLTVFHPEHGTLSFSPIQGGRYLVFRTGPPLDGTRYGIARTFGNVTLSATDILPHIDDVFENISSNVNVRQSASAKLLKMQTEAAAKMMNTSETYIPREIQNNVLAMIGQPKPVKGAYNVPNSLAKINTTLFTNGGKRKSRRQRRQRRKTVRRRR